MYPLAEHCTPELSAVLGTIPLFFIVHLTVLVLWEHISLSSTTPCSGQSILTHLFPYPSFYRSLSPPQASFRLVGPSWVHCSMAEKLLYFYLSLWSCSELFPHFQNLRMQRPNLHTVFRRQHTLNSYGGIISRLLPSEQFLMLDLLIDCYGFLSLYFTSKLSF